MGNESSKDGAPTGFGLRIMGVDLNSPLLNQVSLYEDFIVEVDGCRDLRYLKERNQGLHGLGEKLRLVIFNLITGLERQLELHIRFDPNLSFEQQLGIRIRPEDLECAQSKILRVLGVQENSPAEEADLKPKVDFVVCCLNLDYFDLDHFAEVTEELTSKHPGTTLKMVVYNTQFFEMRIVVLRPSTSWGGSGLIGAEFGTGLQNSLLHLLSGKNRTGMGQVVEPQNQADATSRAMNNLRNSNIGVTQTQEEFSNQVLSETMTVSESRSDQDQLFTVKVASSKNEEKSSRVSQGLTRSHPNPNRIRAKEYANSQNNTTPLSNKKDTENIVQTHGDPKIAVSESNSTDSINSLQQVPPRRKLDETQLIEELIVEKMKVEENQNPLLTQEPGEISVKSHLKIKPKQAVVEFQDDESKVLIFNLEHLNTRYKITKEDLLPLSNFQLKLLKRRKFMNVIP